MRSAVLASWRRCVALPAIEKDVFFYFWSAVFAAVNAVVAVSTDYREWSQMASVAYGAATIACLAAALAARRHRLGGRQMSTLRRVVVGLVLLGAVIVPLFAELTWRAEAQPGAHAQPEVAVIERAGDRLAAGRDPYLVAPTSVGQSPHSDAASIDANTFFPYLPGMVPFGMTNALSGPKELTDARVTLFGFTMLIGAVALALSDASVGRRGRVLQFLVVLPYGALPLVTGGDDMPVLALMLLGLVLAQRRSPVLAGLVLSVAATLKFTAWPVLFLLGLSVRDRADRPAAFRYAVAVGAVAGPVIALGFAANPSAFILNVVRFPLGLAKVHSPAASPLLGQVLVNVMPSHRRLITFVLVAVGFAICAAVYARWRPRTTGAVARFSCFALVVATLLAPATRFGYLIYPANLFVWSFVLDEMGSPVRSPTQGQFASSTWKRRSTRLLVGAVAPPPSAGAIDGFVGSSVTPTSQ